MTPLPDRAADLRLDDRAQGTWSLFTDWCLGTENAFLPADAQTVAGFLADHPAAPSTQRRRVAVINSVHRQLGLSEPGRLPAVRLALASHRRQRLHAISRILGGHLPDIPVTGWPRGLFGRRDALVLILVCAGLDYTDIAALRRGDLDEEGGDLVVRPLQRPVEPICAAPAHSPTAVHRRWAHVQLLVDRFASNRMLAGYFTQRRDAVPDRPPALTPTAARRPLVVRIDRWGHTPLQPVALTAQSIAAITRVYLEGRPPRHPDRDWTRCVEADPPATPPADVDSAVTLDPRYYERGVQARFRAQRDLSVLDGYLDEASERMEGLLRNMASILGADDGWADSRE